MPFDLNGPTRADVSSNDLTTKVSLVVGETEYKDILDYQIQNDILNLGDAFTVTIPNIEGQYKDKFKLGQSIKFFMANSKVHTHTNTQMLEGVIVSREASSDLSTGDVIRVTGADLGWHLQATCGPLFMNLRGVTLGTLINKLVLDPALGWGFKGVKFTNVDNRVARQGALSQRQQTTQSALSNDFANILPRVQITPGQTIADLLVPIAKRAGALINVSGDGYLIIFSPQYDSKSDYVFEHYQFEEKQDRARNNIMKCALSESIDGLYTAVKCVGQSVIPPVLASKEPNPGTFRGSFSSTDTLPFARLQTFTDSEQLTKDYADKRAKWKWQRGIFDSWRYQITVSGHQQGGKFYAPDTMCTVKDSVNGLDGSYYISAVTFSDSLGPDGGPKTQLIIRKPGFLGA